MKSLNKIGDKYFELLKERAKKSKVYSPHQMNGLMLAELLDDPGHKSLYMKLSKVYDNTDLLRIAKNFSERKDIRNKGAYFMRVLKASDIRRLDKK